MLEDHYHCDTLEAAILSEHHGQQHLLTPLRINASSTIFSSQYYNPSFPNDMHTNVIAAASNAASTGSTGTELVAANNLLLSTTTNDVRISHHQELGYSTDVPSQTPWHSHLKPLVTSTAFPLLNSTAFMVKQQQCEDVDDVVPHQVSFMSNYVQCDADDIDVKVLNNDHHYVNNNLHPFTLTTSTPSLRSSPLYLHGNDDEVVLSYHGRASKVTSSKDADNFNDNKISLGGPQRKGTPAYRQTHINAERKRRKAMSNLFATLHSLLPKHGLVKPDRCTIINYVIDYVETLQEKLKDLEKVRSKLESKKKRQQNVGPVDSIQTIFQCDRKIVHKGDQYEDFETKCFHKTLQAPLNVTVRYWGTMDIFITLSCPKRRGLWSNVLKFLEETFALDVQSVTFSSTADVYLNFIYAKVIHIHQKLSIEELQMAVVDFLHVHFKARSS